MIGIESEDDKVRAERELFARFRADFPFYTPRALKVRSKEGAILPMKLNSAQLALHKQVEEQRAETGKVRVLVLKGRQQGVSTYVQARFYWRVTHRKGARAFILTHVDGASENLFRMAQRFYENCPPELRPELGASNAKELSFSKLDSGYKVATAGSKGTGRSDTIQFFHGCLGLDTPLVCPITGRLRRLGDLQVGHLVRTHTGENARISFITEQTKPVYSVKLKGLQDFPLVSTGEHRFWTRSGFMTLDEIREKSGAQLAGECIGFPVFDITDEIDALPFKAPERLRPQGGGRVEHVPEQILPSYALGRIVGLYLAEGCVLRQSNPFRTPSGVCFTVHEREVERTKDWLAAVPGLFTSFSATRKAESRGFNIIVYGRSFAEWMEGFVGSGADKRFPHRWYRMGASFVRGMAHGYLAGDGHSSAERDRRIAVTSIRSALIVGLRDALAALGYGWAGVSHKEAAERHGRQEQEAWTLRLTGPGVDTLSAELGWACPPRKRVGSYGAMEVSGGYAWVPVVSIDPAGEQTVRDLEVDHPDHSYCVLQGATHNSEVSYWPNAEMHVSGALEAVPDVPGTEVFLESTSGGPMGVFYDQCMAAQKGETDYRLVFLGWFMQSEYRRDVPAGFELTGEEQDYAAQYGCDLQQMAWRRAKIRQLGGLHKFRREYPATPEEAFRVEAPGAMWKRDLLDACRIMAEPPLKRVVVAIDPSGGKTKANAEVGIVVAGRGYDGRGYVLEDASGKYSPSEWANKAIALYVKWRADRVIGERNFGGDMVESTMRAANAAIPYKDVVASRGKSQRAEPVVSLYEQGKISHVGMLPALEDEAASWEPGVSTFSPNRVDALVWALTELFLGELEHTYDTSLSWVSSATDLNSAMRF